MQQYSESLSQTISIDCVSSQEKKNQQKILDTLAQLLARSYQSKHKKLMNQNSCIKQYVNQIKSSHSLRGLHLLKKNRQAFEIASQYFEGFELINDIMNSPEIKNKEECLRNVKNVFIILHSQQQ